MGQRPIQHTTPTGRKYEKAPKKGPINVLLDRQFQVCSRISGILKLVAGISISYQRSKGTQQPKTMLNRINPQEFVTRISRF